MHRSCAAQCRTLSGPSQSLCAALCRTSSGDRTHIFPNVNQCLLPEGHTKICADVGFTHSLPHSMCHPESPEGESHTRSSRSTVRHFYGLSEREQERLHNGLMSGMSDTDRDRVLRRASARLDTHSAQREKARDVVAMISCGRTNE